MITTILDSRTVLTTIVLCLTFVFAVCNIVYFLFGLSYIVVLSCDLSLLMPGAGFQGLFLIDTLSSAITVSVLASTWSMKFKVAAIKIVDKVKDNKVRIVFEQGIVSDCRLCPNWCL